MRIALTNDIYQPGGAVGLMADRFVRALLEAGHDATLICGLTDEIGPPPSDIPSVTWPYPTRQRGLLGNVRFYRDLRRESARAFRIWMEAGSADAWISMVPPSGYGAWQVGGKDIPFLYIANSPWAQEWLSAYRQSKGKEACGLRRLLGVWPRRRLERKLVLSARAWMALSPTQLAWMAREHGRAAGIEKHVLEAGVDCQEVRPLAQSARQRLRKELGVKAGEVLLICSRRLVPRTGVNVLIDALALLPQNIRLVITGGGSERPRLEEMATSCAAAERISFTGIVPFARLAALTGAADFSVLPTQELEGFGLAAAEAFAAGTPVIATPVGALSDVVGQFSTELMTADVGAREIAETIGALIADPKWLGPEIRNQARKYAERRFDWQIHKKKFISFVTNLGKSGKR